MRVEFDDLDYTPEGLHLYEGTPFTGIAFENYPNGVLRCEVPFESGKENGKSVDFDEDSNLTSSMEYKNGLKHGLEEHWFDSDRLKTRRIFEFDVLMESEEFGENGETIDRYKRDPSDKLFKLVQNRRKNG